jgi:hypothetical protein
MAINPPYRFSPLQNPVAIKWTVEQPIALWKFVVGMFVITEAEIYVAGGWVLVKKSDRGPLGNSAEAIAYREAYEDLIDDGYHYYGDVWENEATGLVAPPFVSGTSNLFEDFSAAASAAADSHVEGPGADPRSFFGKYNTVYEFQAYNEFKVIVETWYLLSTDDNTA